MFRWVGNNVAMLMALAVASPLSYAADKCERLVATGSPDTPPLLWRDPQDPTHLIGVSADVLKQVAQELGLTVEVLYSGKRAQALEEVRSGRMDLLIDAALTLDDLATLDYVHPALAQNDYMLWSRGDSMPAYRGTADLVGHAGAISTRARPTRSFEQLALEHLNLAKTENLTQAFQKLLLGQVDYVLASRYTGQALVEALGMGNDLTLHQLPVDRPGLYLALSHDSACNEPWLRGQLARKMTELAATGPSPSLLQRNVERWKAQLQPPSAPQQ